MIIIISGCDRTGKTTFCTTLRKHLSQAEYKHFSVPNNEIEAHDEYLNYINSLDENKLYIIDRFYECENIYAPLYRNYCSTYNHEFDKLLRKKHKVLFVYIRADINNIQQRIKDVGDDYVNVDDIEKIYYNYEIYMQSIELPYVILDNNSFSDLQNNINIVLNIINNYNFKDDYFGNLRGNKAVIFLNTIYNPHDHLVAIGANEELKLKKNDNVDIKSDYIIYKEKIVTLVNYTDYFYTNNDDNVNILNINERLYVH